jgi:3-deoxy-7-phosphoheptulonate synthase
MAKAAIAAGADGLQMEVHYKPEEALCDGDQSLYPEEFEKLMQELKMLAPALGRSLPFRKTVMH